MPKLKHLRVAIVSVGIVAAFAVTVGGPWYALHIIGNHDGGMAGCPFSETPSLCPMNVLTHLTLWRLTLASLAPRTLGLLVVSLLLVVVGWLGWRRRRWLLERVKWRDRCLRYLVWRTPPDVERGTLRWALADGILHPKIFPSVTL